MTASIKPAFDLIRKVAFSFVTKSLVPRWFHLSNQETKKYATFWRDTVCTRRNYLTKHHHASNSSCMQICINSAEVRVYQYVHAGITCQQGYFHKTWDTNHTFIDCITMCISKELR